MYSFLFKKQQQTAGLDSNNSAPRPPPPVQGTRAAELYTRNHDEKHPKRIYAPSTTLSPRYDLGEIHKTALFDTDDPNAYIVPLQPSKRRNLPSPLVLAPKARLGKTQDQNSPASLIPFPNASAGSPSGTFGPPPTARELAVTQMKNGSHNQSSRSRASSQTPSETGSSLFYSCFSSTTSITAPGTGCSLSTPSSSNTFGVRTPARSFSSNKRVRYSVDEAFFSHLETPPPLPPLVHPAFLESASQPAVVFPGSQAFGEGFPSLFQNEKEPRLAQSLPAIREASLDGSSETGTTRPRRRGSPKTSVSKGESRSKAEDEEAPRKGHSRTQSKSSMSLRSTASRRSSAEFSAKQASLLGVDSGTDFSHESWEVQVSKELLRLSFGQEVVASGGGHSSARVGSIKRSHGESGAARGLGPAFSLQVSSSPNQDPVHHRTAATAVKGKTDQLLGIHPSTDSAISITSMAETGPNSSKPILNPTAGKFRPKSSNGNGPRSARSHSSPERARTPSPPPPKIDTISAVTSAGAGSSSLLAPPALSITAPTPEASPVVSAKQRVHHKSSPAMPPSALRTVAPSAVQKSHSSGSTKRKADDAEVDSVTPPREREHRTTFAPEPRKHRASATSGSSHAPSSFHRSKRVRTSLTPSDPQTPARGAFATPGDSPNAKSTGSWSSKNSKASASHVTREARSSRPSSAKDAQAAVASPLRSPSRRSLSQASIPMSAFMSPHAPSVSRSSTYHMRDPRKPSRIQDTPWTLAFPDEMEDGQGNVSKWSLDGWVDRGGSPLHSWLFFIGFIIFPLWFLAGFAVPIPRTRRLESGDAEKGVVLDDPQVEHDSKSWRRRCRIMAGVSVVTYVPFIILVAIFA